MGTAIAAFGETWLAGYPGLLRCPHKPKAWRTMAEYLANAVVMPGAVTDRPCDAAKETGIDVGDGDASLTFQALSRLFSPHTLRKRGI
jgi:hypothetical protein